MRTFTFYGLLLLCCLCGISFSGMAQPVNFGATKEKIYVHTDHVFYKPGETAFFKLYLLNAQDQIPSPVSSVVYVDVMNPSGNLMQKLTFQTLTGYAEGSFDFIEALPGGIYKLKAYTTWMRNEKDSGFFVKEITLQKVISPRVLLKLDFPKKGYGAGDQVGADFSMRSLDNQPIRNHSGVFTVSLSGAMHETAAFKTDGEGKAKISFRLPGQLKSSDGLLNITVSYDAYTEAISRSIPLVTNKIDLQFMPEGGTLVQGINSWVAFKAVNENGKAGDIKGIITDDKGQKTATFESYHFGMGKFLFKPQPGVRYKAKIVSPAGINQEYVLPEAAAAGVVMSIGEEDHRTMVTLDASEAQEVILIAKTRDREYYNSKITLQKGPQNITVNGGLFPAGIAQFTLYKNNGQPLAERLVFMNPQKVLQVSITPDKKQYLPREKVTLTIKTTDEKNKPLPSNLSLSVVDDKLWSFADDKQEHILSWLLMSSELKGKIEEPQFYFKKEEPKALPALDLLMLTHGYRYFDYIEYVQTEKKLKFTPDETNILSGLLLNQKAMPVKGTVYLMNSSNEQSKVVQLKTGTDGVFYFPNVIPGYNYYLMARAAGKKDKTTIRVVQNGLGYNPLLAVMLDSVDFNEKDFAVVKNKLAGGKQLFKEVQKKAIEEVEEKREIERLGGVKQLNEVVVVAFGAQRKRMQMAAATQVVRADELQQVPALNLEQALAGRVAGVQIVQQGNPGAEAQIRIRGAMAINNGNQPLFVVNGMPMDRLAPALNVNDIDYVNVMKGATATALYGAQGANGVIVVESKKYRSQRIGVNLNKQAAWATTPVTVNGPNYTVARRFYAPVYFSLEAPERNDFRETIYWNPVVQTGENGEAKVEFYNSDATTTFRAIAEGIGADGKAGRTEATYAAQNALSVDAKIPPYLTVGDKALLPLVIKNNTSSRLDAAISISLPKNMTAGKFSNTVSLAPGASQQLLVPVEATAAMKGVIRFFINSTYNSETVALPVSACEKGFPVIETFSGNDNKSHRFNISKMLPGTSKATLKLFNNIEGQLLDGIESMLREPYGCFEQTSSSTYPNIFVLKYLKQSGKLNQETQSRAMGYLESGYQRLKGYETAQDGFEWFGKTPPHEALTAYGLLEFTDMKEFIKVDEAMLQRTKAFLLSRRDGKGGFLQSQGGYDAFASVPNKIANIYIVYALTQAGIGNEINEEYRNAVKQAAESSDGYQLAMMALAADNMKNESDYNKLMGLLQTHYEKKQLESETSVTNSRGASLKVESLSLYAMALLRNKNPRLVQAAEIVSKILAEKNYYGYGSTQATVLALNAVVELSKKIQQSGPAGNPDFVINSAATAPGAVNAALLKEGVNDFGVLYKNEKDKVPYALEVSYQTFTPPNSAQAEITLQTSLAAKQTRIGETIRMTVAVKNEKDTLQAMAIAKIGIPAGLSVQPWQLKEIMEQNKVAYYEIFDNYLVFYWMGFKPKETKTLQLDLKADVPGTYKSKAATTYLYYMPEHKYWNDGVEVEVLPALEK
jgi:alpha-2-macroglobulin-like protein